MENKDPPRQYTTEVLDDKFEMIDAQLKDLTKNTNYENVKFFKFMNEKIEKNTQGLAWVDTQVRAISDLINLQEVHQEKNLVVALEKELYPRITEKFQEHYD